jgi:hypothetical protein
VEELSGGAWSTSQNITVYLDVYNWPQHPSIAIGDDGIVHAFWYQMFHDDCQNPTGESVYYKTLEAGSWVDRSFMLNGHIGSWTDIALDRFGEPNFVWSEGGTGSMDVWLSCYEPGADVTDTGWAHSLRITAQPNPFDASTELRIESGEAVDFELTVFDVSGRLVRRLAEGMSGPAPRFIPWDGRDAEGRDLPAGAYLARILAGGRSASCGMIRLR